MNNTEKNFRKKIGKKIKLARLETNYTQEKLAEKLSLSSKYISQLERGISFGSATTIVNICKVLNINSDFLFDDLIDVDSSFNFDLIDTDFFKNYQQLDDYNRDVVKLLVNQLITLQEERNKKK